MSLIVAARFQTFDEASQAARQLRHEGFSEDDIHTFYINTAGEHAQYPLGGDRAADPDARGAHRGALAGAALLGLLFAVAGEWWRCGQARQCWWSRWPLAQGHTSARWPGPWGWRASAGAVRRPSPQKMDILRCGRPG